MKPGLKQYTFMSPSGNLCIVQFVGVRGRVASCTADWDCPPSIKDTAALEAWFRREHSAEYGTPRLFRVDDPVQRKLAAESVVFGGGSN